jgi:hypothetical protein
MVLEGIFHVVLKNVAVRELKKEGYKLFIEPRESPFERLVWSLYRPDIFALMVKKHELKIILIECETSPNYKRIMKKTLKIIETINLQKALNEKHIIRYLLLIPPQSLKKVNSLPIRRFWDIWIITKKGEIFCKIPSF